MKRKHWILVAVGLALVSAIVWFNASSSSDAISLTTQVEQGDFVSKVVTSGELQAKNSVQIRGPREVRQYRISEMKIQDLVPEGTIVSKGDYVGRLDPSQLNNSQKDVQNELDKTASQYLQAKLDTALELRAKRDDLKNLKFALEEREIEVKYSEYEPPAIQRQAQINLEKSQRAYKNAKESYQLKRRQAEAQVREVAASLAIQKSNLENIQELMKQFTIKAPQDGMLIYARSWSGQKKKVGSTISSWNPTIAELPDMSTMISKTYINEVDIGKVKEDMPVEIGIDAFPEKKYKGKVTYVANVGENRNGMQGKAFEVNIELLEGDSIIRPGMTTSNHILIFEKENVLSVPLECVNSQDSARYVVVKSGLSKEKREVKLGRSNDNACIIEAGLQKGEEVFLTVPKGVEELPLKSLK